jgi:probable HAF family extracellular repeat protein
MRSHLPPPSASLNRAPVHPFPAGRLLWVAVMLAASPLMAGCGETPSGPSDGGAVAAPVRGAATAAAVASGYILKDIGTLPGGTGSTAFAVNRTRQVVGVSLTIGASGGLENHGFLWSQGTMRDLGNLGFIPAGGRAYSQAIAINDAGKVVGEANRTDGQVHAFLWVNGVMRDLGTLGGTQSSAAAINGAGQVAGFSTLAAAPGATPVTHAFRWQNGVMKDLGTLGGDYSRAFGINAVGEVVGESRTADGRIHAFRWSNGRMTDLLPLAGRSQALAINKGGRVAGVKATRATVWVDGVARVWGPAGEISAATGVNTAGLVVGTTQLNGVSRALLWRKGVRSDLPGTDGGPALGQAYGINAGGDVAGVDFSAGQAAIWLRQQE